MASEESKLEKTNNNQAEEPTRLELKEMLLYKKTELSNIVREDSKLQTRWRAQDHNTGTERIIMHVQGHFFSQLLCLVIAVETVYSRICLSRRPAPAQRILPTRDPKRTGNTSIFLRVSGEFVALQNIHGINHLEQRFQASSDFPLYLVSDKVLLS